MLNLVFQWSGLIFIGILGVALLLFAFSYLIEQINGLIDRFKWDRENIAVREAGIAMIQSAYWFSEDKNMYNVLKEYGKDLRDKGNKYPDCRNVRDRVLRLKEQNSISEE